MIQGQGLAQRKSTLSVRLVMLELELELVFVFVLITLHHIDVTETGL